MLVLILLAAALPIDALKPSVVAFAEGTGEARRVIGSGFVVTADGVVATNAHVAEVLEAPVAIFADGVEKRVIGSLVVDELNDLALVRLEAGTYQPLVLGPSKSVKVGDRVTLLGNPFGLTFSLSEGIVAAVRPNGLPPEVKKRSRAGAADSYLLQITAVAAPGSSGSPVVDVEGRVVGVNQSGYSGTQGLNFAVASHLLAPLLEGVGAGTEVKPFVRGAASNVVRNLSISLAFFGLVALWASWPRLRGKLKRRAGARR